MSALSSPEFLLRRFLPNTMHHLWHRSIICIFYGSSATRYTVLETLVRHCVERQYLSFHRLQIGPWLTYQVKHYRKNFFMYFVCLFFLKLDEHGIDFLSNLLKLLMTYTSKAKMTLSETHCTLTFQNDKKKNIKCLKITFTVFSQRRLMFSVKYKMKKNPT